MDGIDVLQSIYPAPSPGIFCAHRRLRAIGTIEDPYIFRCANPYCNRVYVDPVLRELFS